MWRPFAILLTTHNRKTTDKESDSDNISMEPPVPLVLPPTPTSLSPALTLHTMVPLYHSKGADASHRLSRIEWVEVAGTELNEGNTYYIIHVFMHRSAPHSHIPTTPASRDEATHELTKPTRTEPDYRIRRRISEFVKLRADLEVAVQGAHKQYCHFCNNIQCTLFYSQTRLVMALRTMLVATKLRTHVLDKFLGEVLAKYEASRPPALVRGVCEAAKEVPCILSEFLFGTEQFLVV